jgi:hypothetical protein
VGERRRRKRVAGSSPWQGKGLAAAQGRGKEEDLADTMFEELIPQPCRGWVNSVSYTWVTMGCTQAMGHSHIYTRVHISRPAR